jgi:hypothetical protein
MLPRLLLSLAAAIGMPATGWTLDATPHLERASVSTSGAQGDLFSVRPEISGDGTMVAFISMASNLAPGVTMPGMSIYLRDPARHTTALISAAKDGVRANAMSVDPSFASDGRYVVFSSMATNLTKARTFGKKQIYRKDLISKQVILVSIIRQRLRLGVCRRQLRRLHVFCGPGARLFRHSCEYLCPGYCQVDHSLRKRWTERRDGQ